MKFVTRNRQMIRKYTGSGRRTLTSPAVHPCENISPTTLLTSLITLSRHICSYRWKHFASNARNAHVAIRHVSNLLVFFEEAQVMIGSGWGHGQTESVVLGFSELHLALQKLQYLLEDCIREGARLWMLMKAERVANRFRVLMGAVGTGLDVLPLGSVDVSSEVKEVVQFVMRQVRKTEFCVDLNDIRVIKDVNLILNRFKEGVVPDKDSIKWVLDHIRVMKWSECNREVKFLEAEIGFEYSNHGENRTELAVLSSLTGFMCYARSVLFDSVDTKITQRLDIDGKCFLEVLRCVNSDDFRCPISLEIMKDPVVVETGHTYDRSSILKWFRAGNHTCPKTGNKLVSRELVPNLVLKGLIQQYCVENGIPFSGNNHKNGDIMRTVVAGSLAAEGAIRMVSSFISARLASGLGTEMNKAACEVRILSKTSIFNRSCLIGSGVIPYLLKSLKSEDSLLQENAIAGLLNLSKHSKSKTPMVENGGLDLIVEVLKNGLTLEARQHAAATLFYLASIEEYRKLIGENADAIPALLEVIRSGSDRGKKNSLVAIYGLLIYPGNHWRVLVEGTVPLLLKILMSSELEELITDSLAVLATLAEKPDGAKAIMLHEALPHIVGILDSSTLRAAKEHCVSLLLALCINGGADVVAYLVKSPSLMGSLYSLISDGTHRASKKASSLIRVLLEFCEKSCSGSTAPVFLHERFIHAW